MYKFITFLSILAICFSVSCTDREDRLEAQLEFVKENLQECTNSQKDKTKLQYELEDWKKRAARIKVEWFWTVASQAENAIETYEDLCIDQKCSSRDQFSICSLLNALLHMHIKETRQGSTYSGHEKIPLHSVWSYLKKRLKKLELQVEKYLYTVEHCDWNR